MNRKILGIAVLTCTLAFSQTSFSKSWFCKESLKDMVAELKLDQTQKDKIKPILDQLKTTMEKNGEQMGSLEDQLKQQVNSDTMDDGVVNGLVDKKAVLIGNMMKAKIAAKNQIMKVLTPEQKTEIQDKMKEIADKMKEEYKSCDD